MASEAVTADSEDRRQHLQFIQTAIGRMSSNSALAKGWMLTIAVTTYGYAGTQDARIVAVLGIGAVLMFALVDAHYLQEERRYRLLFDAARANRVPVYEMNAARYCRTLTRAESATLGWSKVVGSWSIRDFYGPTILAGVALLVWLHCHG